MLTIPIPVSPAAFENHPRGCDFCYAELERFAVSWPVETKTENFSDSSLCDRNLGAATQKRILERTGNRRRDSLFLFREQG